MSDRESKLFDTMCRINSLLGSYAASEIYAVTELIQRTLMETCNHQWHLYFEAEEAATGVVRHYYKCNQCHVEKREESHQSRFHNPSFIIQKANQHE